MKPSQLTGEQRAAYVQDMFAKIARRYDLMNRLMTGSQDVRWRRRVIQQTGLQPGGRLLDLGTGTGDLALEALRQQPTLQVVAADFTLAMMQVGQARLRAQKRIDLNWCTADALSLPFPDGHYDGVVSGFLMRNVGDLPQALKEQYRVLKPGGRLVILDTTRPRRNWLWPFIYIHLKFVISTLGRLLTGHSEAYNYLPDSTVGFLPAETLAERMTECGYQQVGFQRLMQGTVAIHWGIKAA
jgi:demethylmenaquinone methyltransferase / 2-methoxy-6-polyprenyl-1,4-benzoquinol methylase